jgi:hypothetical protein
MREKHSSGSSLTRPITIIILGVSVLLGCLVVAASCIILLILNDDLGGAHPSSQELINNFLSHRPEFERLLQMAQEDQELYRVAYDSTRPENPEAIGLTQERLTEYRGLFDELNLEAGIEKGGDNVWFIASARGLSVSGSAKGYIYTQIPPDLVVEDLDNYFSADGRSFTAFQKIEENWYLYYDYED